MSEARAQYLEFLKDRRAGITSELSLEADRAGDHRMNYPVGTKLRDITVAEPTIGCPGDQLARAMWDRVVDVVVGEELWQREAA